MWRVCSSMHSHAKSLNICVHSLGRSSVLCVHVHVCLQVCDQHTGADGSRGLHDCVPEWSHAPQKNAWPWLAEEMLSDD